MDNFTRNTFGTAILACPFSSLLLATAFTLSQGSTVTLALYAETDHGCVSYAFMKTEEILFYTQSWSGSNFLFIGHEYCTVRNIVS